MDSSLRQSLSNRGISLMYAIALAVFVALLMVLVTTISFYRSGAYTTVKQIQTANQYAKVIDQDSLDINTPINASDIDKYAQSIHGRLNSINDKLDFSQDDISDQALGLY